MHMTCNDELFLFAQANNLRHILAQSLYSRLLQHLTGKINQTMEAKSPTSCSKTNQKCTSWTMSPDSNSVHIVDCLAFQNNQVCADNSRSLIRCVSAKLYQYMSFGCVGEEILGLRGSDIPNRNGWIVIPHILFGCLNVFPIKSGHKYHHYYAKPMLMTNT